MNKVTNHKKPIKKRSFAKGVQPFSMSTDSVHENQQLTTDNQTTLVETEEIKLNETQKPELETLELQPNMATETDEVGQADLEATSACLQQKAELEPPSLPLNQTTKLLEVAEIEPELELALELQPNMATETAADEKANLETASSELPPKAELETTREEEKFTEEQPKLATNGSKEEQQPEVSPLDDATESTESTVPVENATIASNQVELDSLEQDDTLLDGAVAITRNRTTHRQMNAPLTVVNHKNGKRVKIGKEVCEELQLADGNLVEVLVKNATVLVCKSLNISAHCLSKGCHIYNKELVELITDSCGLNFEGKSSNSLTQVKYVQSQRRKFAVIS